MIGVCLIGQLSLPFSASAQQTVQNVRELLDVPYVTGGHERQKLDLFLPQVPDDKPCPVIVRIHGGAWRHGDKSAQRGVAGYVKQGYIGVAINYRFSQQAIFPAQIEDCKAAIRWLRANAEEYGIDPERICVVGSSAGGHLAALLGTTGDSQHFDVGEHLGFSSAVCAVVDNFGPTDLLEANRTPGFENKMSMVTQLLGGTVAEKPELAAAANPINYISPADPPFLIIHGDADPIVPINQSELLHAALEKAGVPSQFHIVQGGMHGGNLFKTSQCKILLKDFLKLHVMDKSAISARD